MFQWRQIMFKKTTMLLILLTILVMSLVACNNSTPLIQVVEAGPTEGITAVVEHPPTTSLPTVIASNQAETEITYAIVETGQGFCYNSDGEQIELHTASFSIQNVDRTRKTLAARRDIHHDEEEDAFSWIRDAKRDDPGTRAAGEVVLAISQPVGVDPYVHAHQSHRDIRPVYVSDLRVLGSLLGVDGVA